MNKRNAFVFIAGLTALTGCISTPETPPKPTEFLLPVTNVFLSFEGKEESYYNSSMTVTMLNTETKKGSSFR